MAPLSAARRTLKGRHKLAHANSARANAAELNSAEGPPLKKRKYIPGGPGGGGRYVDIEGTEVIATAASPKRASENTPSIRPRREAPLPIPQPTPQLPPATPPSTRPRRDPTQSQARYSSATAAALALQQGDGYKPREERGWEEFHPDLDIDTKFAVFRSEEIDGVNKPPAPLNSSILPNGFPQAPGCASIDGSNINTPVVPQTPPKRRPGRPPRRPDSMLNGIIAPAEPKVVPLPGPNPRERLTLPKPNFHLRDPFVPYEKKGVGQQNYVDRTMASVGYQESEFFTRHAHQLIRVAEGAAEEDLDLSSPPVDIDDSNAAIGSVGVGRVEYDMDEQDEKWLEDYNAKRKEDQLEAIKPAIFEITMTKIEKEWYSLEKRIPKPNPKPPQTQRPRSSSAAAVNGEPVGSGEEQDTKCAVCDDGDCENSNAIVFCDGCDLAVHQECYGVPYIPEGQWLCRKCQLIGRGSPNCIFCPNTEGAFKQTNTSNWSHLLCAIWIPEVGIGNQSLMEPVTDVEKVPKSRWKLQCYICKQRMGASIQCSNKNCFVAFHVTCARRCQLYLKMKTGHGNNSIMDSHLLKAFCHKHVPPDWRKEHGTDAAYEEAVEYYKEAMQGKRWGDSQAAALALGPSHPHEGVEPSHDHPHQGQSLHITFNAGGNKRKKSVVPRTIWKLPSGAPVIPQAVLNSVVMSLQRFAVRQRKQYAEDACKYWTLKREARRGAALLKRLQLQMETFSSMEMTRRNFETMGPIGRSRLQRRIDFAERLSFDVDKMRSLCGQIKKREDEKLKDVQLLRSIVDTVYFPIPPLLWPILEKARTLDSKGIFWGCLQFVKRRLDERFYTSVSTFSADLAHIFTSEIGVQPAEDTAELQIQISGRAPELSLEQREKRKLAKRIIKSIQPGLEEAIRLESELNGKPFEKELQELDLILENSMLSRRASLADRSTAQDGGHQENSVELDTPVTKAEPSDEAKDIEMEDQVPDAKTVDFDKQLGSAGEVGQIESTDEVTPNEPQFSAPTVNGIIEKSSERVNLQLPVQSASLLERGQLTPPLSFQGDPQLPLAQGGIQWYMQPFDPSGTTIYEERWTGRDVMRGMSEELSEIDEDELMGLVGGELEEGLRPLGSGKATETETPKGNVRRSRRRWKGFR